MNNLAIIRKRRILDLMISGYVANHLMGAWEMTNQNEALDGEIVSAGYAYHGKPYRMIMREGLKQYLFRIQTVGKSRALIGDEYMLLEPGDILLFPPHDPYELIIEAEVQLNGETTVLSGDYYIFFKGTWVDEWWGQSERPRKIKAPSKDAFYSLCRQIAFEQSRYSARNKQILFHFMQIMCISFDRAASEQSSFKGGASHAYRMKTYIEEHAHERFTLADVAEHVTMSVSRAVHLYKSVFDCSIMQYALEVRLTLACERILHSPFPLEQIAETSGFASYTYFHRAFKARFGVSPKQYRSANGG